jgi:hypothetical protein
MSTLELTSSKNEFCSMESLTWNPHTRLKVQLQPISVFRTSAWMEVLDYLQTLKYLNRRNE